MLKFEVQEHQGGQRIDIFLAKNLTELSRSFISKLGDDKKIKVNDKFVKSSHTLKANDTIRVDVDLEKLKQTPSIDLPVLYEDDDCIVIDKPPGVLSHSKGAYNPEATVETFIKSRVRGMEGDRAGIVHRLDRFTSGVMICAKNPKSTAWLQKQFSTRKVKKTYVAVIAGKLEPEAAIIDMPIERNPKNPKTFRVGANGKPSTTEYKTIGANKNYSLLELKPETGRTHQLRVHLKYLKHPIVGDDLYVGHKADRLYLHAVSLELTLPNGQQHTFVSKLPADFNKMVK